MIVNKQYDLSLVDYSYLRERIILLLNDNSVTKKRRIISTTLNIMFVTIIMSISLIFVPEANYEENAEEVYEEEGAFSITPENAYFLKNSDGYNLYIDGEFIATIENIPKDLGEISIYEE